MADYRRRRQSKINFAGLLRIIAFLVFFEGVFMIVPLVTSLCYHESDWAAFLISIGVAVAIGSSSFILPRHRSRDLSKRDGMLLTSLVWVVFSLVGMLPFVISSVRMNVADAFFESMSGFTTTGASVLVDVGNLPHGLHIWRCMMQWIGGVGIILFTVALLPVLNSSGGMQMVNAEISGINRDKISPRVSQTALRLWLIYSILTLLLCMILWIGPMDFFESICHAFSTVSTGGFSTSNDSIGAWDSFYVKFWIMVFMFLGGVSFVIIYRASMGKIREVWGNEIFRTYVFMIVGSALFVSLSMLIGGFRGLTDLVVDPLFRVVSVITSTGYIDSNFVPFADYVFPLIVLLMFCGACAGSTTGGVKIDRIVYLVKNMRNQIYKMIHPNRIYPVIVNGVPRSHETVMTIAGFMILYAIVLFVGGMALAAMGLPLSDAIFSVFSCMANTGIGSGVTESSFAAVPLAGKILLSFWMLIGRLEIFTVIILFTPTFWRN